MIGTSGRQWKQRMMLVATAASAVSVATVAVYLRVLLDLTHAQWVGFFEVLAFWFVIFLAVSQRLQDRSYRPAARWLDLEREGRAEPEDLRSAFAAVLDVPRLSLLNGYTLWPLGGLAVALSMKALFADFGWLDVSIMVAAAVSGGALSSLLIAFLFKRQFEPLRRTLALRIEDPDARAASAPPLPLVWKLQGTVLVTAVVPVVFAVFVAHDQARKPLERFVAERQAEWLDRNLSRLGGSTESSDTVHRWQLVELATGQVLGGDDAFLSPSERGRISADTSPRGALANERQFLAWRRIEPGGRALVAALPRSALGADVESTPKVLIALLAAALGLAFGVAWLVAQDLARGIAGLRTEADRIASGDLSRGEVFESEDELGDLGRAFDRMRQALRETVGRVSAAADRVESSAGEMAGVGTGVASAAADQERAIREARESTDAIREQVAGITSSAQQLSASVEESSSSILEMGAAGEELNQTASVLSARVEEVGSSIEQMIRGVAEMGRSVEGLSEAAVETQSSVEEMAGSLREVDSNAAETARLSAQVVAVAEGGRERVQETIAGMEAIRDATDTVERVIRGLGERTQEIGAIVDVIDDVADETNLLALNAAIIAAQAGEHGRAFSVVADEIKELADRVMSSTKEIGGLIRSVQAESAAAISAIERGSESVWVGVERSAQAGESLEAITRSARESGQRIAEIVQAVQEQSRAASHVQLLMERVRNGVEQLRAATREQEEGQEVVLRGTTTMRDVAQQVHRTTEEQARGGNQIRGGIEVVRQAVERIYQALQDQASACQQSAQTMGRVSSGARANYEASTQLSSSTGELRGAAETLREDIRRFRL
jgi:methyl-accepting chemotaxis protein